MIRLLALVCVCAGLGVGRAPVSELLVLEKAQNTLVIVDPVALRILARVPAGNDPHEVAVSDDGRTAYISNYGAGSGFGGNTITVVDLVSRTQLPAIDLGALRAPHGMAFAGGKVYFTVENSKAVASYDPATRKIDWVVGTGQDRTHMVVVSADAKTVFTTNVSAATVSIIERSARADWRVTNVAVGKGAEGFDLSPDGKELWVANAQDQTISIIDVAGRNVVATIPSTRAANRLKFTIDGRYAFVSDLGGNEMLVIDARTRKEFKRIPLAGNSEGILMSPDGTRVYSTMNSHDAVAVIDLKTMAVTGEVKTGRGPDGLAWAARN